MAGTGLYDDLVMDHIKNARNYRALDDASRTASGSNPLCGDEITLYLKISDELLEDVAFQCTCCGVSMASASMMTEIVKGKSVADARMLLEKVLAAVNDRALSDIRGAEAMQRALLATVQEFPARNRCASLPWLTLEAALDGRPHAVFVR